MIGRISARGRREAAPAFCILAALGLSGCHTWAPVEVVSPIAAGTELRVTLTRAEALRQAGEDGDVRDVIPGTVVEDAGATVALTTSKLGSSREARLFRDYVRIPWAEVVRTEEKRFSPLRTLALGAGMGAVAAVILSVTEGGSTDGNGETPGPNQAVRIPLLRLPF